jgi:hypothetical protein
MFDILPNYCVLSLYLMNSNILRLYESFAEAQG